MVELASGDLWHSGGYIGVCLASPFAGRISNTLITRGYTAQNLHCQNMEDCLAGTVGYPLLRRTLSKPPPDPARWGSFWGLSLKSWPDDPEGAVGARGTGQGWGVPRKCQWSGCGVWLRHWGDMDVVVVVSGFYQCLL